MRGLLLILCATVSMPLAAQSGKKVEKPVVLRSGEVISCHVDKGCTQEMLGGQRVLTMEVDGVRVRATLGQEQKVSFADLTITNQTAGALEVKPEDFRIEVDDATFNRLSYVDPKGGRHAYLEPKAERVGKGLPPPGYWTSVEHKEAKEARLAAEGSHVALLPMGSVAQGGSVTGRVYFERPKGTTDRSLILPFRSAILGFPFPKAESRKDAKKRAKEGADRTAVLQEQTGGSHEGDNR